MSRKVEEEFIKASLNFFRDLKKGLTPEKKNSRINDIFRIIKKNT